MSYTLTMAADQEPQIADDGVQEVPLTIARPRLTRLIEQVREDGLVSAFTVRGRRRAYLVTPDFHDQAVKDRAFLDALQRAVATWPKEKQEQFGRDWVTGLTSH
jgi:hypothetical protein